MKRIIGEKDIERDRARNFFDRHYLNLASGILNYDDYVHLGNEKFKKCRFCGKKEGEVTFDEKAHVFPQCIGNEFLLSYYECDSCNKFFGGKLEGEFSNCFSFYHSLYKIKGKKKVPVFQENGGKIKNEWKKDPDNGKDVYVFHDTIDARTVEIDQEKHTFIKRGKSDSYIPIAVFKCFVKMAIGIMPEIEAKNFRDTAQWLKKSEHYNYYKKNKRLLCRFVQIAGFSNRVPQYTLFKRKYVNDFPYMLFQITYGGFSYLIEVPRNSSDSHLKTIEHIPFPPLYYESIDEGCYDFTGIERIAEERKIVCSFGTMDEEAGRNKIKKLFPELEDMNDTEQTETKT